MRFVTVDEAAEILGLSPTRVRALASTGELQADKLGRDWIFNFSVIERASKKQRPGPGRPESTVDDATLAERMLRAIGQRPATVSGLAERFDERAVRVRRLLDDLTEKGVVETDFERGRGQIWRIAPIRGVRLRLRDDLRSSRIDPPTS